MAADLWGVDCGGVSCSARRDIVEWLGDFDVSVMNANETLERSPNAVMCHTRPCAVVGLIQSAEIRQPVLLNNSTCLASLAACVLLDETFDERLGVNLLRTGVQEYLDVTRIDANELIRRIEYAVIRSESQEYPIVNRQLATVDWQRTNDIYHGLPRCEREVLDLLIAMRDPKQIARELGKGYTTVRTQTKNLREKFDVESTQQLVVLMVHTLYQRPASSH
ncbi:MAG: helix-turn-helix transcriptional regulator [Planctomycetes bacterium]|nr:helix-turn-helix transcriptional regulator [Planctomycetota bacterium]